MSNKKTRRQSEIVNLLSRSPTMRVNDLAAELQVTGETIRRDLDELHRKGLLERTYGGAILQMKNEPGLNIRHSLLIKEREAIARQVVQEIKGARYFMIGSGATTVHIARRIAAELSNITCIVHSFGVATQLVHNPTIRVVMAPGIYHADEGANHGSHTVRFLQGFWVDYAIISASGLTPEGPSDAEIDAGEVYATMISRAYRSIIAADKSKYGLKFPARFAQWKNIDILISDQQPPDDLAAILDQSGVTFRTALTGTL
ncbi:DeoR/GlpR family DNA-binding transcription regulator [bacterium]|jgi:DeoR/GlpR family transcriptional regulator of sugar metabolism|nr:DeoR/GlpR family DNA-binding transcription regulator [bacterium]